MASIEAYPLYWPEGRERTSRHNREAARFDTTFARARDEVVHQVEMLCGRYEWMKRKTDTIISTNIPLRRDGLPLANTRLPDDVGVAVYFNYKNQAVCFACDRWEKIQDNMQAIAKTIDALRGIARWGTGDMMEAAFKGFTALPSSQSDSWYVVLSVAPDAPESVVRDAYRSARSTAHPDRGGSPAAFDKVTRAWSAYCAKQGITP